VYLAVQLKGGTTIIRTKPQPSDQPPSEAQQAVRGRFQEAVTYAKGRWLTDQRRGYAQRTGCHARHSAAWRPAVRQASGSGDPDAAEFRRVGRGGTRFLEENGFLKETQMRLGAASDSTGGGGGN